VQHSRSRWNSTGSIQFQSNRNSRGNRSTLLCSSSKSEWSPDSWRKYLKTDQHSSNISAFLPSGDVLEGVERKLTSLPILVSPGEIAALKESLKRACLGKAFVVHAGDPNASASQTGSREKRIESTFRLLVAQVIVLAYLSGLPTVKIGFVEHSPIMADCLVEDACVSDVDQLAQASVSKYSDWAMALNMLRAIAKSTGSMMEWVDLIKTQIEDGAIAESSDVKKFEKVHPKTAQFLRMITLVDDALQFVTACGVDVANDVFREPEFYTSSDLSTLWYEQAFTRNDKTYGTKGEYFCTAGHLLVVNMENLGSNSPYFEFLRGVENPICIRVGPSSDTSKICEMLTALNPKNDPGRIVILVGMGPEGMWKHFPNLIRTVETCKANNVVYCCDPMIENEAILRNGSRTRPFDLILAEVEAFFSVCEAESAIPGGIHLNMTGEQINEVFGGSFGFESRQVTSPGPGEQSRLNGLQALEIAYETGNCLRRLRNRAEIH